MSTWTQMDRRIGMWSAIAMVLITVTFIITGAIWLVTNIASVRSQGLEPSEPLLTILETLIVLSTPAIVALFTAIHAYAPLNKKTCSLTAFGFAVLLAGITGMVHFVQLTAVRRTANKNVAEVFALYDPGGKLTPMLAIDLLAWDFFLGFGLLFAATLFKGDKLQAAIRVSMILRDCFVWREFRVQRRVTFGCNTLLSSVAPLCFLLSVFCWQCCSLVRASLLIYYVLKISDHDEAMSELPNQPGHA